MVAGAAADAAGGRPVWWLPDRADAERMLRAGAARGRPAADHGRGRRGRSGPEATRRERAGGRGARPSRSPASPPSARAGGATGSPVPAADERLAELLRWAADEEIAVGVVGSGSNLLVADAGFRGLVIKLDGALATIEQRGERLALRRWRAAAPGGRAGCPCRSQRPRVRREHPRHGRRRGADERERLRRRPRARARVGRRRDAGRHRPPRRPRSSASPTGARTSAPGRWWRARRSPSRRRRRRR